MTTPAETLAPHLAEIARQLGRIADALGERNAAQPEPFHSAPLGRVVDRRVFDGVNHPGAPKNPARALEAENAAGCHKKAPVAENSPSRASMDPPGPADAPEDDSRPHDHWGHNPERPPTLRQPKFRPRSPLYTSVCEARNPRWTVVRTYTGRWWVAEPGPSTGFKMDPDIFVDTHGAALKRAIILAASGHSGTFTEFIKELGGMR